MYEMYDTIRLPQNPTTHSFDCEVCGGEVTSREATNSSGDARLLSRFVEATNPINRILKNLEGIIMPDFDPEDYLRTQASIIKAEDQNEDYDEADFSMLPVAGSTSAKRSKTENTKGEELSVELVDSKATGKTVKAPVHALPQWYSHSTITGQAIAPASTSKQTASNPTAPTVTTNATAVNYIKQYEMAALSSIATSSTTNTSVTAEADEPSSNVQVMVKGVPKDIHSITDEDKAEMTEEEYQKYYEAYMLL